MNREEPLNILFKPTLVPGTMRCTPLHDLGCRLCHLDFDVDLNPHHYHRPPPPPHHHHHPLSIFIIFHPYLSCLFAFILHLRFLHSSSVPVVPSRLLLSTVKTIGVWISLCHHSINRGESPINRGGSPINGGGSLPVIHICIAQLCC